MYEAGGGEAVPVDLDSLATDGCLRAGLGVGQLAVDDAPVLPRRRRELELALDAVVALLCAGGGETGFRVTNSGSAHTPPGFFGSQGFGLMSSFRFFSCSLYWITLVPSYFEKSVDARNLKALD
jgi:hypothetical protein